ncbi:MAG TPA: phospho-N-acetylmuramoyl-pentapeptide-transferase [Candidatus Dormibacteraeota bacterium]|jgi:phospho-N-acetylmuramoyl-pentapeptide-transferase|nr:phospho-N-acetylmuramoyl-pentapeptide-transferase [Candidatus Dormibacteraeota bacterium]
MIRPALAFAGSLLLGLLLYPAVISTLARFKAGQRVQAYAPATHLRKAGTPTMGGVLFCTLPVGAWLFLDHGRAGFLAVFALLGGAAIGVVDDVANIRGRGALGLHGRQKLVLQLLVGVLVGIGLDAVGLTREIIPGVGAVNLHWLIIPLAALAVIACSNAVNLTDGVDGLAGSTSVIALVTMWALAQHAGNAPVAVVSASLCGGVLAFLFYNWWPARVFMGDTGSLALGCALVALAAELRLLWLLPLLGAVFVAETLSVIINVTAIRRFGRRVFRASPLHHHFEELGLREQRLVICFAGAAAVAAILCAALALPSGVAA